MRRREELSLSFSPLRDGRSGEAAAGEQRRENIEREAHVHTYGLEAPASPSVSAYTCTHRPTHSLTQRCCYSYSCCMPFSQRRPRDARVSEAGDSVCTNIEGASRERVSLCLRVSLFRPLFFHPWRSSGLFYFFIALDLAAALVSGLWHPHDAVTSDTEASFPQCHWVREDSEKGGGRRWGNGSRQISLIAAIAGLRGMR